MGSKWKACLQKFYLENRCLWTVILVFKIITTKYKFFLNTLNAYLNVSWGTIFLTSINNLRQVYGEAKWLSWGIYFKIMNTRDSNVLVIWQRRYFCWLCLIKFNSHITFTNHEFTTFFLSSYITAFDFPSNQELRGVFYLHVKSWVKTSFKNDANFF